MISPSVAIKSPASQTKTSPFFNSEELIFLISPLAKTCLAGVSSVFFLNCQLVFPLASAIASAKLQTKRC
jgi:hypothetical protein